MFPSGGQGRPASVPEFSAAGHSGRIPPTFSNGGVAWHRRVQSPSSSEKSLFPLPFPPQPGRVGCSYKSSRRHRRRLGVWRDVCQSVSSLNALYGCGGEASPNHVASPGQASALTHILKTIARRRPGDVQEGRAAAGQLLGSHLDYVGEGTSVVCYDPDLVSLPQGQQPPVRLRDVVPAKLADEMRLEYMLADEHVQAQNLEVAPPAPYMDVSLKGSRRRRVGFYRRLFLCGILSFTQTPQGFVAPFFVRKKGGSNALS